MQTMLIRTAGSQNALPAPMQPMLFPAVEPKRQVITVEPAVIPTTVVENKRLPFVEANTREVTLSHLRNECVVPVFSKDNEITISHPDFINAVYDAACTVFPNESIDTPDVRVSHIIKGRIPEAIHKPVKDLLESDKTIYYERMMFCIEVPSIYQDMEGNRLNLTIGGVRAYNHENLYSKKTFEKFKIFIGFKNMVCCNLCISTDGLKSELKAMCVGDIVKSAIELFQSYNLQKHLLAMGAYKDAILTESQFAHFIGRARLYQYLPVSEKKRIPQMLLTDTQIGAVARSYFQDDNFSAGSEKEINLWKFYNLLTGANKSSYIDDFLDRSLNASQIVDGLTYALSYGETGYSWFLR